MPRWLYGFLLFALCAVVLEYFVVPPLRLFILTSHGVVPLAGQVSQSVERIAEHTGEALGGLLFAASGNAAEMLIGSVLCNVLLVLGVATCMGSAKHSRLRFDRRVATACFR